MRTFCIYKEFCFKNDVIVNEFVKKNCVEQLDKGMSEKKIISPLGKIRRERRNVHIALVIFLKVKTFVNINTL